MTQNLVATASTTVNAPLAKVWQALVDPVAIEQYMFGTTVTSDWKKGSPISWKGEWKGKAYKDKGVILAVEPETARQYRHFSPISGQPDKPENYHTVTIDLADAGGRRGSPSTRHKNSTEQEEQHSQKNWEMMLGGLKKYVEK